MPCDLQRYECYPNNPVPMLLRVSERKTGHTYDLVLSYHHTKVAQVGQVKVYKNNRPIEYVGAAIMKDGINLEVIGPGEKLRQFKVEFGEADCKFPLVFSSDSKHRLAVKLRATFKKFPKLPGLSKFQDYLPLSVAAEDEHSIVMLMPRGRVIAFDAGTFFNLEDVPDDLFGCLFGPGACLVSVIVFVVLMCRSAYVIISPEAQAFLNCVLACRRKYRGQDLETSPGYARCVNGCTRGLNLAAPK